MNKTVSERANDLQVKIKELKKDALIELTQLMQDATKAVQASKPIMAEIVNAIEEDGEEVVASWTPLACNGIESDYFDINYQLQYGIDGELVIVSGVSQDFQSEDSELEITLYYATLSEISAMYTILNRIIENAKKDKIVREL